MPIDVGVLSMPTCPLQALNLHAKSNAVVGVDKVKFEARMMKWDFGNWNKTLLLCARALYKIDYSYFPRDGAERRSLTDTEQTWEELHNKL